MCAFPFRASVFLFKHLRCEEQSQARGKTIAHDFLAIAQEAGRSRRSTQRKWQAHDIRARWAHSTYSWWSFGPSAAASTDTAAQSMSPTNIFAPVSTPAKSIFGLSIFVLAVTAAIFVVVFALLTYSVVKFRKRANDDGREPPQVYGSNQVELAWTVIPVLIVVALFMATARVIADVQKTARPENAIEVIAIGHQFWWEYRYPALES